MADYTSETLRELLVAALKASGRKQVWIAEQLNISQKHLSQLLTGRVELTLGWAQRIAVLCDHRIDIRVTPLPGTAGLQRRLAELQPEIDRLAALGAVTAVAPPGCQELAELADGSPPRRGCIRHVWPEQQPKEARS